MEHFQNVIHHLLLKLYQKYSGTEHTGTQGLLLLGSYNIICEMLAAMLEWTNLAHVVALSEGFSTNS